MNEIKLTIEQINDMKHCIGYQPPSNVPKRGVLNAYRNYYTTNNNGVKHLDELVDIGFMTVGEFGEYKNKIYRVTSKGIDYLAELFNIRIKQDKEDIIE